MSLNIAFRYWHTLRHLKPVQFYGRLWFRFYRPQPDLRPAPPLREPGAGWQLPACREPSLRGPELFVFLGEEGCLADVGWSGDARSKLWRYNQHYFDDLNAEGAGDRSEWHQALLARWVAENPTGQGDGWEPYPSSLRIVNWVKWALAGNQLPAKCVASLAVQARWLARRLEIHLLGNHLFANAKALVFAGCFFQGVEAERWLRTGFRILAREVPEQILADGGHFERSTMYHALALEDMLDLLNLLRCLDQASSSASPLENRALHSQLGDFLQAWPALIQKMVSWLQAMCHPDGEIAFFNDAAFAIAPPTSSLLAYVDRLGLGATSASPDGLGAPPAWLAESGYIRLCNASAVLLFDTAPVGPDYLPGHGHADTLSVELSLFGQRVLVNSGTSEYGLGPERLRQRGTAAHNTVVVNGEDSSEVWSGFRVARRARVTAIEAQLQGPVQMASASHDGYTCLPNRVVVGRAIRLKVEALLIDDEPLPASAKGGCVNAAAHFHLHPAVVASQPGADGLELRLPNGERVRMQFDGAASVSIDESTWHPRFGVAEPNRRISVALASARLQTRISWSPQ
ncbi:heparinase II/III family protein [Haliea salexigens]|uniref:heparinase II/III family protein n=1 Tax=Haliea salexigens TaxID=287487 RepID=UPI0003F9730E|nr:heparinase II/III family protein [Haliea salexigens]